MNCPNCGNEVQENYNFCKYCGTRLDKAIVSQTITANPAEAEVEKAVTRRLDGIKNKDETLVNTIIDTGKYSKFDDWPPYNRQKGDEALKNEFGAFKVLSNYKYEYKDFKAEIIGDTAVATFLLHYSGEMRKRRFEVYSRVTTVLEKQGSEWKIIHEHYSRFSEERRQGWLR